MQDIIRKLKFKDKAVVFNSPTDIKKEFIELGFTTSFDKKAKSTSTLVFINNNKEYLDFLQK
ncbi:MAG TPA: hypothetical protein VEV62_18485, partial [Parafilimonas sp.]|nr:hypothetical protein [Parafilimonas sp.]